jgi:hypothetical protein
MFYLQDVPVKARATLLDFLYDLERSDRHLLDMPIRDFLDQLSHPSDVSYDFERLLRETDIDEFLRTILSDVAPPETMDFPLFRLLEELRFDAQEFRESRADEERRIREQKEDEARRERSSTQEEPQIPGWLKFVSKVAENMHDARQREMDAECEKEYRAGFEAARHGRRRRSKLIAEMSEFFDAWNAGYDAGSR